MRFGARRCGSDRTNAIATLVLGGCLAYLAFRFVNWAVVNAIWTLPPDAGSSLCRAARGDGACWAVIHERFRFILLGGYPYEAQWRPAVACVLFVSLYVMSARRAWWTPWLLVPWMVLPISAIVLLRGGVFGLDEVPSEFWGGLPLTFLLSTVGFAAAFPLAVALALGRRSQMPAIRVLSIAYIEIVRGVPLVTFLFMASVMFPLFVSPGVTVDKVLRAQIAFVIVIAAYVAEVVRAGLAAVPTGQYEAAASLGLALLARDHARRPAAGVARLDPRPRQHVHRLLQGHVARDGDRAVRPARRGQGGARRREVGGIRRRGLPLRRRGLLRVLLGDFAIQPVSRARAAGTKPSVITSATAEVGPVFHIQMQSVDKWFGDLHVLRNINLTVTRGERIVICGPSGSGKSTLIRCINRLEPHQKGRIIVDGVELTNDVQTIDEVRRHVGMVFQQFNLFPHLTILENCTLAPIWVKKMSTREAEEVAMHYLGASRSRSRPTSIPVSSRAASSSGRPSRGRCA